MCASVWVGPGKIKERIAYPQLKTWLYERYPKLSSELPALCLCLCTTLYYRYNIKCLSIGHSDTQYWQLLGKDMDILYTVESEICQKWRYSNKVKKVFPQDVVLIVQWCAQSQAAHEWLWMVHLSKCHIQYGGDAASQCSVCVYMSGPTTTLLCCPVADYLYII